MADAIIAYAGPVVTRKQAKADGLKRYFQGSKCPKGHTSERFTGNGECVVCASFRQTSNIQKTRERNAKSRLKHIDAVRERNRRQSAAKRAADPVAAREKWRSQYRADPEKAIARKKKWEAENRALLSERRRVYRAANPKHEDNRARVKAWRIANPDAYIAQVHLRRSRKIGAEGTYGAEDVQRMLEHQKGLCNGCACDIRSKYTVDHMIPLSRGGSNWPSNLQLLCKRCNSAKNNRTMEEWLAIKELICLALQNRVSP